MAPRLKYSFHLTEYDLGKIDLVVLKFIYSEKAKNFCEISTLLLSVCTVDILLWHLQNIRTLSACPSIGNFVEFNKEFYFSFLILIDYSSNKSRFGRAGINLYYGLRTPNTAC